MSELQTLRIINLLSFNLRNYLTTVTSSYGVLYRALDILKHLYILKQVYPDNANDIERLRQHIENYALKSVVLNPEGYIINWSNTELLSDLNSIF